MGNGYSNDPMIDLFIFETSQLIENLETYMLNCEKNKILTSDEINEIFRIMHTLKGSYSMMMFDNLAELAHSLEDVFHILREENIENLDYSKLSNIVIESVDFMKCEVDKLRNGCEVDGNADDLNKNIKAFLDELNLANGLNGTKKKTKDKKSAQKEKQRYYVSSKKPVNNGKNNIEDIGISKSNSNYFKAKIFFEDECKFENIRAYSVVHELKPHCDDIKFNPEDVFDNDESSETIRKDGFLMLIKTKNTYGFINEIFMRTALLKSLEMSVIESEDEISEYFGRKKTKKNRKISERENKTDFNDEGLELSESEISKDSKNESFAQYDNKSSGLQNLNEMHISQQDMISVRVDKLDRLMDLVGEMVIAESMVTQNPDLKGLKLDNFHKSARQLNKISREIQDMVMSIRMVPLSATFQKMHRVVRDMCKKLGKEAELEIIGEQTEVDKNIITHIFDPLIHIIRNSVDHGIEFPEERERLGKSKEGKIVLEAKNSGSEVFITVKDDGRGLNKENILKRARENNLLTKLENEMSENEIFNIIFLPGFSTKEKVSEYSGRGVGMDIVSKNIEKVGGSILVESKEGQGTTITLKIPLTLAIIDGMNIRAGGTYYTIPTNNIKESINPKDINIINGFEGKEMVMIRGNCYPILYLNKYFNYEGYEGNHERGEEIEKKSEEGILIMVEAENKSFCLFADELLGQQQIVMKTLPAYIRNFKRVKGLTGCTLLGDGSISLILDTVSLSTVLK